MAYIVIKNHTLKEYNNKYKYRRHKLLCYSLDEVKKFDLEYKKYQVNDKTKYIKLDNALLNRKTWWLINDKYYQIPDVLTLTWFINLFR